MIRAQMAQIFVRLSNIFLIMIGNLRRIFRSLGSGLDFIIILLRLGPSLLQLLSGKFAAAVNYALNRRDLMMTYLEDGRCSLSNNLSEQKMKSFVTGRKGWLFCDTPEGAEASAIAYSFAEMASAVCS